MATRKRYYYAGQSSMGSSTSYGFANDWTVYVFDSRKSRDAWVSTPGNLSRKAIKKDEVTKHAANWICERNEYYKPRPFTRQYWGIETVFDGKMLDVPGCVGEIVVADHDEFHFLEPLF